MLGRIQDDGYVNSTISSMIKIPPVFRVVLGCLNALCVQYFDNNKIDTWHTLLKCGTSSWKVTKTLFYSFVTKHVVLYYTMISKYISLQTFQMYCAGIYECSYFTITIWLTVTKYPYIKWQWIFYILRIFFLSSITFKTNFTGLDCIYE